MSALLLYLAIEVLFEGVCLRMSFINLNYFGGMSPTLLRESTALKQHAQSNSYGMMLFFSDIFLDDPQVSINN